MANAAERHCHIPSRQSFRQPICGLDKACLTGDRLRLNRFPATASRKFLTPEPTYPTRQVERGPQLGSSSPTNKSATCRPPFHSGLIRCGPIITGPLTAIEVAMGAART
uniref:Uncharacterized protein n=1 Tax=Sinorhizobium sp. M14 TaxID=430451 RepID=R4ILL0_9HYPH|nr:hypothetical protein [Sinorhizobium sp. M14]